MKNSFWQLTFYRTFAQGSSTLWFKTLIIKLIILFPIFTIPSGFGQPLSLNTQEVDRLKQSLSVVNEDTNRVINLWRLARFHTMTQPRQAVDYADESITLARKLNYTYGELVSLQALEVV